MPADDEGSFDSSPVAPPVAVVPQTTVQLQPLPQSQPVTQNPLPAPNVGGSESAAPSASDNPVVNDAPFASAGVMVGGAVSDVQLKATSAAQQAQVKATGYAAQAETQAQYATQEAANAQRNLDQNLQREWDRLRSYEDQLRKREDDLRRREVDVEALMPQQPNFPKHCPFVKPQVYHNIQADFIPSRQAFMRSLYSNYYILCFLLVYQCAIDLAVLLAPDAKEGDDGDTKTQPDWAEHLGVSILYLIGICFAFVIWYWPTYKALSRRNPGQYRWAYLGLAAAVVFNAVMLLGFVGHGGIGVMFCANVLDKKDAGTLAIMAVIGAGAWMLQLLFFVYASYTVRKCYKEDVVRQALPDQMRSAAQGVVGAAAVREMKKTRAM